MSIEQRIGIDFGGTKIAGLLIDAGGHTLAERRVPTPREDYGASIEAIAQLVAHLKLEAGVERAHVGLGIPGSLSPRTGLVRNANSTWLIGRDLKRDLERRLGQPVRIENDANCLVLSEAIDGAGAGHRTVFGVILGTGVGGGIVVDRHVLAGRNLIAGEWGHNPLTQPPGLEDPEPPPCYCGRKGCIEVYLSGPGLALDHRRATGQDRSGEAIVAAAEAGADPAAEESLDRYCRRLGSALAAMINVIDPDVIVLGGGLSRVAALYERIDAATAPYVFSDHWETPILPAVHGDASGVRGAAWLWSPDRSGAAA